MPGERVRHALVPSFDVVDVARKLDMNLFLVRLVNVLIQPVVAALAQDVRLQGAADRHRKDVLGCQLGAAT